MITKKAHSIKIAEAGNDDEWRKMINDFALGKTKKLTPEAYNNFDAGFSDYTLRRNASIRRAELLSKLKRGASLAGSVAAMGAAVYGLHSLLKDDYKKTAMGDVIGSNTDSIRRFDPLLRAHLLAVQQGRRLGASLKTAGDNFEDRKPRLFLHEIFGKKSPKKKFGIGFNTKSFGTDTDLVRDKIKVSWKDILTPKRIGIAALLLGGSGLAAHLARQHDINKKQNAMTK